MRLIGYGTDTKRISIILSFWTPWIFVSSLTHARNEHKLPCGTPAFRRALLTARFADSTTPRPTAATTHLIVHT